MAKIMRSVMAAVTIVLITATTKSLLAEPLLVIYTDDEANVQDVREKSGSLTEELLKLPVRIEGLRMISMVSLIFAEVVGVDGTVAVCRPCQGDWCPVRGDELRYIIDDTAQDIRIQARVADKWLDVQRGGSSDYIWQEPTPAVAEIRSLKTHNIAVLQDEDGSRHGLVLSGITTSAEGGGPGPSIWFDPEVFHR